MTHFAASDDSELCPAWQENEQVSVGLVDRVKGGSDEGAEPEPEPDSEPAISEGVRKAIFTGLDPIDFINCNMLGSIELTESAISNFTTWRTSTPHRSTS